MNAYTLVIDSLKCSITKVDEGYEFTLKYKYSNYFGITMMAQIGQLEGLQDYLDYCGKSCMIEDFNKYILLRIPIPFSPKYETIKLYRQYPDDIHKLNRIVKRQRERIKFLEDALESRQNTAATLDLVYEKEKGWYLDYAAYFQQKGSNKYNSDLLRYLLCDKLYLGTDPSATAGWGPEIYVDGGISIYTNSVYQDLDEMLYALHKPLFDSTMPYKPRDRKYWPSPYLFYYNFNSPIKAVYNIPQFNYIQLVGSHMQNIVCSEGKYPFDELLELLGKDRFIAIRYTIPSKKILYKRIPSDCCEFKNNIWRSITEQVKILIRSIDIAENKIAEPVPVGSATYIFVE